ncbi:unnamed protein product [Absidia cylindrospora]
MTGSFLGGWLTVTTGLFSFFFLLSAFAWILSRDHKMDDIEKRQEKPEEGHYIISNNIAVNKNDIKTETTAPTIESMPSPMVRAMLPCATKRNMVLATTLKNDISMTDARTILNLPIPHSFSPPSAFISFFNPQPPSSTTRMLGSVSHNYLTWWLHTKNRVPDG